MIEEANGSKIQQLLKIMAHGKQRFVMQPAISPAEQGFNDVTISEMKAELEKSCIKRVEV